MWTTIGVNVILYFIVI